MPTYANDLPADCPPIEASPANGAVFRLVRHDPVTDADFLTYFELGRQLARSDSELECRRRGLSVFRDYQAAEHARRVMPGLGKFIASGNLRPEHGALAQTGQKRHHTWWPFEGVGRAKLFPVVMSGDQA